jgi:hypothetical protein
MSCAVSREILTPQIQSQLPTKLFLRAGRAFVFGIQHCVRNWLLDRQIELCLSLTEQFATVKLFVMTFDGYYETIHCIFEERQFCHLGQNSFRFETLEFENVSLASSVFRSFTDRTTVSMK